MTRQTFALFILGASLAFPAFSDSDLAQETAFAWGENTGWLNLYGDGANGVAVAPSFLSGYAWGENVGWLFFGDGEPADGVRYSNASKDDIGVNHDGEGGLSGFAWGENVGWIDFDSTTKGGSQVGINPDGTWRGFAWGENIGWINFGTDQIALADSDADGIPDRFETGTGVFTSAYDTGTAANVADSDADGMFDGFEVRHGLNPHSGEGDDGPFADLDLDGFTNIEEFAAGTDPTNPNSFPGSEGAGEGMGENELCENYFLVDIQFLVLLIFSLFDDDLDNDGLPDAVALRLFQYTVCENVDSAIGAATLNAFEINRERWLEALEGTDFAAYAESLAVLASVSADSASSYRTLIVNQGADVTAEFTPVTCAGGLCAPTAIPGKSLAEAYNVFDSSVKAVNEPYSGTGDYDGDGVDNRTEYANAIAQGASDAAFVVAATDPAFDGTEPELLDLEGMGQGDGAGEGEGEGTGEPVTGCNRIAAGGEPFGVADFALIALLPLLLIGAGRRERSRTR